MTHIYEWLETNENNPDVKKLWDFLDFRTREVVWQWDNKDKEPDYKVICTYKEKEYRITGASRLGDVWIHEDFNSDTSYTKRVDIDSCHSFRYIDKAEEEKMYVIQKHKEDNKLKAKDIRDCLWKKHEIGAAFYNLSKRLGTDLYDISLHKNGTTVSAEIRSLEDLETLVNKSKIKG